MEPDKQASALDTIKSSLTIDGNGRLLLKGQEMVLLPRHFFRYILREVKNSVDDATFEHIFHKAGFDGAFTFCTRYREIHSCSPQEAVEAYLAEMSARGWGAFNIELFNPDEGVLRVALSGSALIPDGDLPSGHIIWKGAMLGAIRSLPNMSEHPALAAAMDETTNGCAITVRPQ